VYASPERTLLFDVNDFDETLPGPFEWDLKRLVTSFVVLGRHRGFSSSTIAGAAQAVVTAYRTRINELAQVSTLSVWYDRIDEVLLVSSPPRASVRKSSRCCRRGSPRHDVRRRQMRPPSSPRCLQTAPTDSKPTHPC
jgi:uncharacterized protein (DUF2252 family)